MDVGHTGGDDIDGWRPCKRRDMGTTTITATLGGVTSPNDMLTVTAATLSVDRGDAGEPVDRQGATQQFTATGRTPTARQQNLTSQVTWASATRRWRRFNADAAWPGVCGGHDERSRRR